MHTCIHAYIHTFIHTPIYCERTKLFLKDLKTSHGYLRPSKKEKSHEPNKLKPFLFRVGIRSRCSNLPPNSAEYVMTFSCQFGVVLQIRMKVSEETCFTP